MPYLHLFDCLLAEQDERVYKDESRGDTEPDKEREETIESSNEISLGMAGAMVSIEGTDSSESGAGKSPIGCGDEHSTSYSPDHHPQAQSAANHGRQGTRKLCIRSMMHVTSAMWWEKGVGAVKFALPLFKNPPPPHITRL